MSNFARMPGIVAALVLMFTFVGSANAAIIQINNNDGPGEGFNDTTPRAPVGGNSGNTLGEQRLIALQAAADLLAIRIASSVMIQVDAEFNMLQCAPNSAAIGAAGATAFFADFPNVPIANTFYPVALANALAGEDMDGRADIDAVFNSGIDDNPLCLVGVDWYYGLDDMPGNDLNFLSTATHELVHGLGFVTITNLVTGAFGDGSPDIFATLIRDLTFDATWPQLTAQQRSVSAQNDGNVVWDGVSTTQSGAASLSNGTNQGQVQLYAPAPLEQGSSISHWDVSLSPNALMEPFDTSDVEVTNGTGLATCQLQDIGWTLINGTQCPDMGGVVGSPSISSSGSGFGSSSGGSGGGGGCVLTRGNASIDPMLPLLLLLTLVSLGYRRAKARY